MKHFALAALSVSAFALTSLCSSASFADIGVDQRFTFQSAAAAYATARVPRATDLVGNWLEVAEAYPTFSKYAADGKFADADGTTDKRYFSFSITSGDLFGAPVIQLEDLIHDPDQTWRDALMKATEVTDAVDFRETRAEKKSEGLHFKCRITSAPEVLLCQNLYDFQKPALESYLAHVRSP